MKLASVLVVTSIVIPAVSSFAQANQPFTRAEVKAQLVQVERAGWNPSQSQTTYPANIQAAEAKIAAQNGASYGGSVNGSSADGAPALSGAAAQPVLVGE